jgi:hypothetical protein
MRNGLDSGIELLVYRGVELDGESLLWEATAPIRRAARPLTFSEFADHLNPENDQEILKFARKWGVMGVCSEHGLPVSHALIPGGASLGINPCWPAKVAKNGAEYYSEPLSFWRRAITKTQALRRIGSDILSDGTGRPEDWRILSSIEVSGDEPWNKKSRARMMLGLEVQDWLNIGRVAPEFSWDGRENRWAMRHVAPGGGQWPLFSWLALHLAIEVAGGRGVICPYCQGTYFPDRLPSPGQRHCCPTNPACRKKRDAEYKRDQRRGKSQ